MKPKGACRSVAVASLGELDSLAVGVEAGCGPSYAEARTGRPRKEREHPENRQSADGPTGSLHTPSSGFWATVVAVPLASVQ
jgi:hypothetical protein